jgi:hypothetical protein
VFSSLKNLTEKIPSHKKTEWVMEDESTVLFVFAEEANFVVAPSLWFDTNIGGHR